MTIFKVNIKINLHNVNYVYSSVLDIVYYQIESETQQTHTHIHFAIVTQDINVHIYKIKIEMEYQNIGNWVLF